MRVHVRPVTTNGTPGGTLGVVVSRVMPPVKFVDAMLKSLHGTPGSRTTVYDALQPGLELRISAKGRRSWCVRPYFRGERVRVTLGFIDRAVGGLPKLSLKQARVACAEAQTKAADGIDPRRRRYAASATEDDGALTIERLCQRAIAKLVLTKRTRSEWARLVKAEIAPAFPKTLPDQLDRRQIFEWGDAITEGRRWWKPLAGQRPAPTPAIAAFEVLRRCFRWGVGRDLIRATPFVELEPPGVRNESNRTLATDELRAVWRALMALDLRAEADERLIRQLKGRPKRGKGWRRGTMLDRDGAGNDAYTDTVRLLLLSFGRRGMAIGAREEELEALDDEKTARWTVPAARMKSKRDHVVPLVPLTVAIMRRGLERKRDGHLFPAKYGADGEMTWSSRFVRELKATASLILFQGAEKKMASWKIHELRHTAATHAREDVGIEESIVSLLLAHKPVGIPKVTSVYLRAFRLEERRAALKKWADWVEAL